MNVSADIEWGHLRIGPMLLTWFNSDTAYNCWGSTTICWDFKVSFLFCFHEIHKCPWFQVREVDPDIRRVMKGNKYL